MSAYYPEDTERAAHRVVERAVRSGKKVATAESCTGGLVCGAITDVAGSSDALVGGVVSYANEVKEHVLGVPASVLASVGAVSEETARAMANGVRELLHADVAVSTTGVAGPGGGSADKPVGTVWFGISNADGTRAYLEHFDGNRSEVRNQAVGFALRLLEEGLEG